MTMSRSSLRIRCTQSMVVLALHAVIGNHDLAHPKVAAAHDPTDAEVAFGGMPAALRLDPWPTSEALAGLRVVEDRVRSVDRVLSFDVPAFGGLPVLLEPSPKIG